ncbi:hypothetical protein CONPUDRAFT_88432 [Coniophora puteana RWD-64-598 SS2]|uniref:Ankyrin n=1 Tax=Coniophora puteana (strain RWD-64-598) TaxID=741705 RepID=A0A5M3MYA7_CONPW|nr:uncharacterized protein CONPUDRAFT_88432 [Coniophora puteana RWD-64-598 SS2]EIW84110.1 hypothetical protein CONPUDRAFT_88432 [Coniophora puteana RWD-64-598 SS2]
MNRRSLECLPVEIIHDIQLYACSSSLPQTNKHLQGVFRSSQTGYRARYLIACLQSGKVKEFDAATVILKFPICTQEVLDAVFRISPDIIKLGYHPELPRRLFRHLAPRTSCKHSAANEPEWSAEDYPIPLLKYLYDHPKLPRPNINSHEGYALTKAVYAGFVPLVRFLLSKGASPKRKGCMPIAVAIHRKDLALVRLLIERDANGPCSTTKTSKGKKRKLEDRLVVTPELLKVAVKSDARDIVQYFTQEKGCVPDMNTIRLM